MDYRTRRDRGMRREAAFEAQMDAFIEAYMEWGAARSDRATPGYYAEATRGDLPADSGAITLKVVDVFSMFSLSKLVLILTHLL